METSELFTQIKELRYDRMRLGQAVSSIAEVPSMPEMRFALVPLTEAEYDECLELAGMIEAPENPAGFLRRDRRANAETLVRSIRNPAALAERVFKDVDDLRDVLEVQDLNFLTDKYFEMVATSSPSIDGFQEKELEEAKKVLQTIDWNELSGSQWYALKRFLMSLGIPQLLARSPGSFSIKSLTPMKEEEESTPSV